MLIASNKGRGQARFLRRWRYAAAAFVAIIACSAAAYELRSNLLTLAARYLVVDDKLEAADAIYLLNGDFNRRPFHAAELYHKRLAPRIIIARAEDSPSVVLGITQNTTDLSIQTLKQLGVLDEAIVQLRPPGGVTSTFDEARALRDYAMAVRPHKMIIVTSEFHSRRASRVFRNLFRNTGIVFMLSPVADLKYTVNNWWLQEDGFLACQNEYVKLLFYKLHYGI